MEVVDANGGYINSLGTSEWGSVEKGVKQAIFWSRAYADATGTSTTLRWRDDKEVIDRYTPTDEGVRRVAEEHKRFWRWA